MLVWLLAALATLAADPLGAFRVQIDDLPAGVVAIAYDADGTLWALAAAGLTALGSAGERLRRIDVPGLDRPAGLARSTRGGWLVADRGADVVVEVDAEQRVVARHGSGPETPLRQPTDVAARADVVAIADTGNARVVLLGRDGTPRGVVRPRRGEAGFLRRPVAVAFGPGGEIIVSDEASSRIQVFAADGTHLRAIGDHGAFPGLLTAPHGVHVHGDRLFVADTGNHRVQVFALDGTVLDEWGLHALRPKEGEGRLHYPREVAIAPTGDAAAVVEPWERRVQLFGPRGEAAPILVPPGPDAGATHFGAHVATDGDLLVTTAPGSHDIVVHDLRVGTPIRVAVAGGFGDAPGKGSLPSGVALDVDAGVLVVANRGHRRLQRFRIDRDPEAPLRFEPRMVHLAAEVDLLALGGAGGLDLPHPIDPRGVALRGAEILLADGANGAILVFNQRLRPVGKLVDGLDEPVAITAGEDRLLVVDRGAGSIVEIAGSGPPQRIEVPGLDDPFAVAILPGGDLLVTDAAAHRLVRVPREAAARSVGGPGVGRLAFHRPRGVVVADDGRIVVVDQGNHRLQLLDADLGFLEAFGARLYVQPTLAPPVPAVPRDADPGA